MFVDGRKMGSGSLYTVMNSCKDMRGGHMSGGFVDVTHYCRCCHLQDVHPDRVHQAATGMRMANDKQDKRSPLMMTHYCTCLKSCAREVFTTPGAYRRQSHGSLPYLSQSAVPGKYPSISMHSCKKLGGQNNTLQSQEVLIVISWVLQIKLSLILQMTNIFKY